MKQLTTNVSRILIIAFTLLLPCAAANRSFLDALRGARAGDAGSQYTVGMMYMFGQGTQPDPSEGGRWLEKSARAGMPQAMIALANFLDVGHGVPLYTARALQLRRELAQAGDAFARAQLEDERKYPGQRDFRRASTLLDLNLYAAALPYAKRAAAAGSINGQILLGRAYHFELGTPRNLTEAVRWYRASAEGGLADGARHLAYMYEFGLGVRPNRATALVYYDRAAAGGDERAKRAASNLRSPDYDQPTNYGAFAEGLPTSTPDCGNGNYSRYNGAGRCVDGNGNNDGRLVF